MKKAKYFLFFIVFSFTISACKKEKNEPTPITVTPDCQTNNYGIIKVTFTDNTVAHSVIVTYPNQSFREKIIGIGTLEDTVRVKTGNFTMAFASLTTLGLAIEQSVTSNSVTSCQEYTIGVSF
jgi:hypothetical protein